jgi:DNA-binding response OmpR family regulator
MGSSMQKTIIVVDDDPAILDLVEMVLDEEGYEVKTATNGREALDLLAAQQPTMVLLDLMMPVMDGWSFCRLVKGNAATKNLPIIIMSADRHLGQKADDVSADDFLVKPFDIDMLLDTVAKYSRPN